MMNYLPLGCVVPQCHQLSIRPSGTAQEILHGPRIRRIHTGSLKDRLLLRRLKDLVLQQEFPEPIGGIGALRGDNVTTSIRSSGEAQRPQIERGEWTVRVSISPPTSLLGNMEKT